MLLEVVCLWVGAEQEQAWELGAIITSVEI